jgi:AraC-like DNA-binding protein/ligand-binding sensor protein
LSKEIVRLTKAPINPGEFEKVAKTLANLGRFPAHYGQMDTYFQSLESNGSRPGHPPVAWQTALIDERKFPEFAAKGLEPRGCPNTRESTQEAGEVRARDENLELLRAIVTSKTFTEFQRAFTGATGLPVALRPVQSFQLSFQELSNQGPFCALMARENRTCGACLQSQSRAREAAVENVHTRVCYAGLCETVVPLRLGNRLIGFLWTGQVFERKPTEPQFQRTLKLLASWGMKLDRKVLRGAYFETRVVSREQLAAAVKLLTIFAEHLAILSNQILIQRDNAEPPMISKAKDFILEHHAEDLSLPQVARFANASRFHFCKLFKRSTGLSFTNFLSRVRIESSKGLLINPQLRVSEIAYEVGFQSLTHFNRVFQKLLGQSPTEYRLKARNGEKVTRPFNTK